MVAAAAAAARNRFTSAIERERRRDVDGEYVSHPGQRCGLLSHPKSIGGERTNRRRGGRGDCDSAVDAHCTALVHYSRSTSRERIYRTQEG